MSNDDIRNCLVRAPDGFRATWNQICDDMAREKRDWIARLRAQGYKAAHPNDGWVDRERNIITFCYPHFDDGAKSGDLMMLGWASENPLTRWWRPIRLIDDVSRSGLIGAKRFTFEDAEETALEDMT